MTKIIVNDGVVVIPDLAKRLRDVDQGELRTKIEQRLIIAKQVVAMRQEWFLRFGCEKRDAQSDSQFNGNLLAKFVGDTLGAWHRWCGRCGETTHQVS